MRVRITLEFSVFSVFTVAERNETMSADDKSRAAVSFRGDNATIPLKFAAVAAANDNDGRRYSLGSH